MQRKIRTVSKRVEPGTRIALGHRRILLTRGMRPGALVISAIAVGVVGCSADPDPRGPATDLRERSANTMELAIGQRAEYGYSECAKPIGITVLESGTRNGLPWAQVLVEPCLSYPYITPVYLGTQADHRAPDAVHLDLVRVSAERVLLDVGSGYNPLAAIPSSVSVIDRPAPGTVERFRYQPTARPSGEFVAPYARLNDPESAVSMVTVDAVSRDSRAEWSMVGFVGDESRVPGWGTLRIDGITPRDHEPYGVGWDGTTIEMSLTWE